MAGTVTTTEIIFDSSPLKKITFDYTTSAGGAADGTTTAAITGLLERVVFDYGDATAAYDVVVNDADGTDILHGNGANLAAADVVKSNAADGLGAVVNSTLTLGVTNGGNAKIGKVHLYFR